MIHLNKLTLAHSSRTLLNSADAHFAQGQITALVGRNGAGKSTLLRAIAALESPKSGNIVIAGTNLSEMSAEQRARHISFVNTQRVRVANLLCRDVVAIGRAPYTNWMGKLQQQDVDIVTKALEAVGMVDFAQRSIDTLSDGEAQRIMIAKALAQQTPIILLDEPTAFLDIPTRFEICRLLQHLAHTQGKTIIFSTHDIDAALPVCDSIAVLEKCDLQLLSVAKARGVINDLFSL